MFVFEMPKVVHIHNPALGLICRLVQVSIMAYFTVFVMWWNKGYQVFDTPISGVVADVKGVAWTEVPRWRKNVGSPIAIWTSSEYNLQPIQKAGFYLTTAIKKIDVQTWDYCPDPGTQSGLHCRTDSECPQGGESPSDLEHDDADEYDSDDSWIYTGKCMESQRCQVFGWCPETGNNETGQFYGYDRRFNTQLYPPPNLFEQPYAAFTDLSFLATRRSQFRADRSTGVILEDAVNFTVFIKNTVEFPYFNLKRQNILEWMTEDYLINCIYEPNNRKHMYCPNFRLGDVIRFAQADANKLLGFGGVISIGINWQCDLDWSSQYCLPTYDFIQLDAVDADVGAGESDPANRISIHFGRPGQGQGRILLSIRGIQFLIQVTGKAGKFNMLQFTMRCGSGLALLSIATMLCNFFVLNLTRDRQLYKKAIRDDRSLQRLLRVAASAHFTWSRRSMLVRRPRRLAEDGSTGLERESAGGESIAVPADEDRTCEVVSHTRPVALQSRMGSRHCRGNRVSFLQGSDESRDVNSTDSSVDWAGREGKCSQIVDKRASILIDPNQRPSPVVETVESPVCD